MVHHPGHLLAIVLSFQQFLTPDDVDILSCDGCPECCRISGLYSLDKTKCDNPKCLQTFTNTPFPPLQPGAEGRLSLRATDLKDHLKKIESDDIK